MDRERQAAAGELHRGPGRRRLVGQDRRRAASPGIHQTVVYDLTGAFPEGVTQYKVRLRSYMRMNIDYVAVDTTPNEAVSVNEIAPNSAKLGFKGVSAYVDDALSALPVRRHRRHDALEQEAHSPATATCANCYSMPMTASSSWTPVMTWQSHSKSPLRPLRAWSART